MNNIFDWNHISDRLSEDEREELKSYYKVYQRKCWAFKRALKRYKLLHYLSLRSKRFRGVGEQRKTKERYFARAKLGRESK